MKKFIAGFACLLILGLSLAGCKRNTPKAVADKFLNSFYHLDYDGARNLSTDDTKKMLDMWQDLLAMVPDSEKENDKKIVITIKSVDENEDKATVHYITSENPKDQTLHLVKQKGKWLAQWTKEDQLSGEDNTDTTANGNNAAIDQSTDSTGNVSQDTSSGAQSSDTPPAPAEKKPGN